MTEPVRVCFVCSGNICRSPTAEVVFTRLTERRGLDGRVVASSAGTGGWHVGDDMDERSRATLEAAGYRWPRHTARQFTADDFDELDVVIALDAGHLAELRELAAGTDDPAAARAKIAMLRQWDPAADPSDLDVADPYYGGRRGFTDVLEQVERSCAGLLDELAARTG
ncbi:low molecular weight protein-tyrosine-phosphatase [Jatrophihabitans fulvus]